MKSKYICAYLEAERLKLDLSVLDKKLGLVAELLPKDFQDSVGLLLELMMLFTRLKSKCLLLSKAVELHESLKYQNIGGISKDTDFNNDFTMV